MNTTDSEKNNYYFDDVKKIEVEQKCFDRTYKTENNFSLKKNEGKNIQIYSSVKWYYIMVFLSCYRNLGGLKH